MTVLIPTGFKSTDQVLSRARRGPRQRRVRQYLPRRHRPRDEEIVSRRLYAGVRRCHLLRLYQMRDTYARAQDSRAPKSRSPWRGDMCRRGHCGTRRGLEFKLARTCHKGPWGNEPDRGDWSGPFSRVWIREGAGRAAGRWNLDYESPLCDVDHVSDEFGRIKGIVRTGIRPFVIFVE